MDTKPKHKGSNQKEGPSMEHIESKEKRNNIKGARNPERGNERSR